MPRKYISIRKESDRKLFERKKKVLEERAGRELTKVDVVMRALEEIDEE